MQGVHLRKYGVAATIDFELYEIDGVDFRVDGVHASGDSKIMKNEGAEANTTNGFTDEGQGYSIVLSATEMQAARIVVYFVDQTSPKAWLDKALVIETYGHASALHAFDLDVALADATLGTCTTNTDMVGTNGANTVVPDAAGVAPTAVEVRQEIDSNSTRLDADMTSRAPASEYNTEMARITANVATEAKQDIMQISVDLIEAISKNKKILNVATSKWELYNVAGDTIILTWDAYDKDGNVVSIDVGVPTQIGVPY